MNAQNAELQRLLASLSGNSNPARTSFNTRAQPNELTSSSQHAFLNNQSFSIPGLGGLPSEQLGDGGSHLRGGGDGTKPADPRQSALRLPVKYPDRSASTTPITQPVPDASTIVTWPAAIKHVTKHIVNNEKAASRIKHLINEQHKHEEQWWAQRQILVTKHAGREENQSKVADILKELGGLAIPIAKVDEAADKNELEAFDKKVYKSLVQMAADFDGQLRKMGVPFYAIKHDLVLLDSKQDAGSTTSRLDKGELRELQKRMLQYLEDLLIDG